MSPHTQHPGPSPSRPAVVVYALCGVLGIAGLFAAVRDVGLADDVDPVIAPVIAPVVAPVVAAPVDARFAVGVWVNGSDVVVLDASGAGSTCVGGFNSAFRWHVEGNEVKDGGGALVGVLEAEGRGLVVNDQTFAMTALPAPVKPVDAVGGDL